jgi:hypothetical protein
LRNICKVLITLEDDGSGDEDSRMGEGRRAGTSSARAENDITVY